MVRAGSSWTGGLPYGSQGLLKISDGDKFADLIFQDFYRRRKADADCVVGEKFKDPKGREEDCDCTDEDYEWSVWLQGSLHKKLL